MVLAVFRMSHQAEGENPLRVKMHGGDEAVIVAGNVEHDHIPATGRLNQIRRPMHLSQRREVFELCRLDECRPFRQGRCSRGMFARPQAHGRWFNDFHPLGQNVLSVAFRQERKCKGGIPTHTICQVSAGRVQRAFQRSLRSRLEQG